MSFDEAVAVLPDAPADGSSERYRKLQRWRSLYDGTRHAHKKVSWDGQRDEHPLDTYQIESGTLHAGEESTTPIKYRRPDVPLRMGTAIVNEFSDLIFGEDRRPKIIVESNEDTQAWLRSVCRISDLLDEFLHVRDLGGSTGSVGIMFWFDGGVPKFRCIDAKQAVPKFKGSHSLEVDEIRIQYVYETEELVKKNVGQGKTEEVPETVERWYRRDITSERDTLYNNPKREKGKPPSFRVEQEVEHRFGFCPVVWIQNQRNDGEIDGLPDYFGVEEVLDKIDMVLSQAGRSVLYNADPTLHVATDRQPKVHKTGSSYTLATEKGGSASMIEVSGEAADISLRYVERLRMYVQMITRCALDIPDVGGRDRVTSKEIYRRDLGMYAQADRLRVSYGKGLKRLLVLLCRAAHALQKPRIVKTDDGKHEKVQFSISMPDGSPDYPAEANPEIKLKWGRYFHPSPKELKEIVDATSAAVMSGLLDRESAVEFIASYIPYKDAKDILAAVLKEEKEREDMLDPTKAKDE